MTKARELAELSRTIIDTSDATAITINADEEVTLADDLFLADGKKAVFGAASDLQIYHDGSNSYISDQGTGDLRIWADSPNIATANGNKIFFGNNGAAELYFTGGVKKLATTSSGVEITGTLSATGVLTVIDGSTSAPSISNAGDSNSGIYFPADDELGLLVGGSRKLHVTSSGVDIENGSLTGSAATFSGSIQTTGSSSYFISNSSSSGDYIRLYAGSGTGKWDIYGNGANLRIGDNDSAGAVVIDTHVGIGTGTSSPTYTLDVLKDSHNGTIAQFGGNGGDGSFTDVRIRNTHQASGSTNEGARLIFELGSTNAAWLEAFKEADGTSAGNRTGGLAFYTTSSNSSTEKMRIDSTGNVGIGSDQPSRHLTLYKAGSTQTQIQFQNGDTGQTSGDGFSIGMDNGKKGFLWGYDDQDIYIGSSTNGTQLYVDNANSRIGIGTNAPQNLLHVYGGSSGSSYVTDGADKVIIEHSDSVTMDFRTPANAQALLLFSDGTRAQGLIGYNHSDDSLRFANNGNTERLRIADGGNVGIGTNNPAGLLTIRGTGDAIRVESTNTGSGGAQLDLLHHTTSPADADTPGAVNFGGYYSGTTPAYSAAIRSIWTDVSARTGRLEFFARNGTDFNTALKITNSEASFYGPTGNSAPGVIDIYGRNHSGYGSSQVARSRIGSVISGSANAYYTDMVLSTTNNSNVMTERLRLHNTGAVRVNNGFLKLSQHHGIKVFTGYMAGNASANFDVVVYSQGVYEITAAFNHYGYIASYGCARKALCSNGPGVTSGSLSVHDVFSPITSGYGGEWIFGSQSGNDSSVRVTKNAGTYAGGGYYMVRVDGNMGLS